MSAKPTRPDQLPAPDCYVAEEEVARRVAAARDTGPGFTIGENTKVRAALKFWLVGFGAIAAAGAGFTRVEMGRAADTRRVESVETEQREIRAMVREIRDTTIRIQTNTESMQRQLDRERK